MALHQSSTDSQMFIMNHDLCPLGTPHRNIAITFGTQRLEWCGYPMVKKYEDMFICFDRVHECVIQTDR